MGKWLGGDCKLISSNQKYSAKIHLSGRLPEVLYSFARVVII